MGSKRSSVDGARKSADNKVVPRVVPGPTIAGDLPSREFPAAAVGPWLRTKRCHCTILKSINEGQRAQLRPRPQPRWQAEMHLPQRRQAHDSSTLSPCDRAIQAAPKRPVAGSFQTGPIIIIIMVLVLGSGAMLRRRAITKWSH
jgi:hypothetical protein